MEKPSREFFDAAFAKIDAFSRERAIIIGDSLTSDIKGGAASGIKTVWFNPRRLPVMGEIIPDFEIADLSELPDVLEKM